MGIPHCFLLYPLLYIMGIPHYLLPPPSPLYHGHTSLLLPTPSPVYHGHSSLLLPTPSPLSWAFLTACSLHPLLSIMGIPHCLLAQDLTEHCLIPHHWECEVLVSHRVSSTSLV
jgi:hypothetical protein